MKEILEMIETVDLNDTAKLEVWLSVPSNELYQVSSLGRVKHKSGNIKKPYLSSHGYYRVTLYKDGASKTYKVASLVAEAFHGPRPEGNFIDHVDGVKTNDTPENLEYVTPRENTRRHFKGKRGVMGVHYCEKRKMWNAQISVKFEKITLGWFDTKPEAEAAYIGAERAITKWVK